MRRKGLTEGNENLMEESILGGKMKGFVPMDNFNMKSQEFNYVPNEIIIINNEIIFCYIQFIKTGKEYS